MLAASKSRGNVPSVPEFHEFKVVRDGPLVQVDVHRGARVLRRCPALASRAMMLFGYATRPDAADTAHSQEWLCH